MMQFSLRAAITDSMSPEVIANIVKNGIEECHRHAASVGYHVDKIDEDFDNNVINFTATCSEAARVFVICSPFDKHKALVYGNQLWPNLSTTPEIITTLSQLNVVHGLNRAPYSLLPGTMHEHWHNWLSYHVRCGRLIGVTPEDDPLAELGKS